VGEQVPSRCPRCSSALSVSELRCPECDLTMTGDFARCRFCELPPEQLRFLEVFIRCRGVIRQMEKALGVSYPTVRSRIDDLLRALRFDERPPAAQTIRDILTQLDRNEISAEQAVNRLRETRGRRP